MEQLATDVTALRAASEDPSLWEDATKAKSILQKLTLKEKLLQQFEKVAASAASLDEIFQLTAMEEDPALLADIETQLRTTSKQATLLEQSSLFTGEADMNPCFIELHAGAGGTESHDWAEILLRMYIRWAETHGYQAEIIDKIDGEEAGIKSATVKVTGDYAYGWAKTESGVHRLVRISPFNAAGKRQTSFASVWVYPEIDERIEIAIDEKDLRIDTYRASGAGGQHVNKTESAVRITHVPSGIVVQCQNDRSQHRNKAECMKMLRSRLYEVELQKQEQSLQAQNDAKTDAGWGHQIRSYVMQPYQMVKDLRTNVETSDIHAVLDGALDPFMLSNLIRLCHQPGESR